MVRQATEDANAGTTFLKERKESVASFQSLHTSDRAKSSLDALGDVAQVAQTALSSMGGKGGGAMGGAAGMAMEQGAQEGIVEAAKANKRSRFAEFFFGQDARYSTAVQQATKNFANGEYIRQAQKLGENVNLTPEEYRRQMDIEVTQNIRETYKDDKDAMDTAMAAWTSQAHKLAREQANQHMAYSQQQSFVAGLNDVTQQFDMIHLNSTQASTEDAKLEAQEELTELLSKDFVYTAADGAQATKLASRNIQVKAVEQQLAAGNTAVLQGLPENFGEGLTLEQQERVAKAYGKYDAAIASESEVIVEEGLIFAEQGDLVGLNAQVSRLTAMQPRLSGSSESLDKFGEDKLRLLKASNRGANKAAKQAEEMAVVKEYYQARETGNSGKAGANYSPEVQEGADDLVVATAALRVSSSLGLPTPTSEEEVLNLALSNKSAMLTIAMKAEKYGSISPGLAEAAKQSVMNLQPDEKGFVKEEDLKQLDNLRVLYDKAPGAMRKALGADGSAMLEITMSNSREPLKEILNKRSAYVKNKGITLSKQELNIPPEKSMGDFVTDKLGGNLDGAAVSYYTEQLKTGYRIYGGDTKAAENYMRQMHKVNNQEWRGKVVKNAGLVGTNVRQSLEYIEGTGIGQELIAARIPAGLQDPSKRLRGLSELNDVQFEVHPGSGDMIISSSQFSYPIVLSVQTLEVIANKAKADTAKAKELATAARMNAFKQQVKEVPQSQMWPTPQKVDRSRTQYWPTPKKQ